MDHLWPMKWITLLVSPSPISVDEDQACASWEKVLRFAPNEMIQMRAHLSPARQAGTTPSPVGNHLLAVGGYITYSASLYPVGSAPWLALPWPAGQGTHPCRQHFPDFWVSWPGARFDRWQPLVGVGSEIGDYRKRAVGFSLLLFCLRPSRATTALSPCSPSSCPPDWAPGALGIRPPFGPPAW